MHGLTDFLEYCKKRNISILVAMTPSLAVYIHLIVDLLMRYSAMLNWWENSETYTIEVQLDPETIFFSASGVTL